ncbi:hypothetical protein HYC85_027272 [Camellia sinensis]|uniref:Uncharacterized protein n=1 Tax=Camellia sinensis TaxID=4442 RepID=A0A7J7G5Z6_CAMSI|nr:hypothetical protein HYC85_027272 [Camellia sinensis]
MALLEDKPADINEYSTAEQVALSESWKKSNRLSLMFMKMTIANNIKTSLPQTVNALEYLKAVEDQFRSANKSLAGTIMTELTTMKYDGNRGVQDHIFNMADKAEEVRLREERRQIALAVTHGAIKKKKDDFSRYGYVYLIHEKSQAVDILEVYITEVERQLDTKVLDRDGFNPLHLAAIKGKVEVLRELVGKMPQAALPKLNHQQTILHLCVKHFQMDALKLLMEETDDVQILGLVNATDDYGYTILHLAVTDKQIQIVKYLASRVDVNAINKNGLMALDILSQSRREVEDWEIGNSIQEAGGLKAADIPLSGNGNKSARPSNMLSIVVFGKMINLQIPKSKASQYNFYTAGEAVVAYHYEDSYKYYLRANTIGFVASLNTILFLISGLPFKCKTCGHSYKGQGCTPTHNDCCNSSVVWSYGAPVPWPHSSLDREVVEEKGEIYVGTS